MSHPNPSLTNMSTFLEGPEKERVQQLKRLKRTREMPRKWISNQVKPPDRFHPDDEPSLAKYRRVEINPTINSPDSTASMEMRSQLVYSDILRVEEMCSSENPINGQPIPEESLALEPDRTICSLNEPKPQLFNEVIEVIYNNSSDEDVAACSSKNEEIHPKVNYISMKLGIDRCEYARDGYVENLKWKIARQQERLDDERRILQSQIDKLQRERKAFDRKRLDKIFQFQFAKCPVYLGD
ncbi:uncharacterized protein [Drosophila kikkawai]|uniref:Uncharacterized protein n=1 Tax=Drosophila kikkawai TaxID=30033 RepID=A0ABM4GJS4_DROKI